MRRTCSKIDSLVEKNKEKFSSRVALGSSVIFHVETTSVRRFSSFLNNSVQDHLRYGLSGRRTLYNVVDDTFEKKTSGIAFSAIYFVRIPIICYIINVFRVIWTRRIEISGFLRSLKRCPDFVPFALASHSLESILLILSLFLNSFDVRRILWSKDLVLRLNWRCWAG